MPPAIDPARVRIGIADDHHLFREGLSRLLASDSRLAIVGQASTGSEAVQLAARVQPDVLLLDVAMPDMAGVDALPSIDTEAVRVILLTAAIEPAELLRAIQFGARGLVLKEAAPDQLLDAIHRVMAGKYVLGEGTVDTLADAVRRVRSEPSHRYGLTPRELNIVSAIVAGRSNRDIAATLHITLPTVKNHLSNIFDKTGVSSRLELALFALKHSLVDQ